MTMDGDSSTTDASQLGISADYIGGSHYVIQPHDDTEDSMNDHEDTNGSKESFREQDIYLPIANVARIMKNAIPQTGKAMKGEKGIGGAVTATDGLSEELTEEAFTNQLPAGLITTDGQQQNVMVYTTSYQQISGVQQIQFS
ncbi:nuclear transcription factor Y subunit beta isoform g [Homo sapiens]|uniref:nuclear transcription factor Y subunit beta isoform g n=2 Tax=Hominoidea TaxID=314295 RepID=UPI002265B946|nr:nuclear transcription factor Y subunit beta isoform g [Homo sapiens]